MILAIVNNFLVEQIITIDDSSYALYANNQAAIDVTATTPQPQVGWIFNGSTLTAPANMIDTKITKLAFRERFTLAEQVGIKAAEIGSGQVALTLQVLEDYATAATYIDLSRTDTQTEVATLVSLGLLTQDRATAILTTPPTAIELYQD